VRKHKKKKIKRNKKTPLIEEPTESRNHKSKRSKTIDIPLGHLPALHFKKDHIRELCEKWQELAKFPQITDMLQKWNINPNAVSYLKQKYTNELSSTYISNKPDVANSQSRELVPVSKSSIVQRLADAPSQFRQKIIKNGLQILGIAS
jgi:hypothetical protein